MMKMTAKDLEVKLESNEIKIKKQKKREKELTLEQINLQFFTPLISAFLWASETAEAFISMPTT